MTVPVPNPFCDAVDLRHLDRQTLDDASLADELLQLFVVQAQRCLERLDSRTPGEAAETAHMLKGAARAVGAFRVADAAEAIETSTLRGGPRPDALSELRERIAEVRQFVASLQLNRPA